MLHLLAYMQIASRSMQPSVGCVRKQIVQLQDNEDREIAGMRLLRHSRCRNNLCYACSGCMLLNIFSILSLN